MKTIEERAIDYASHSYIEDGNINTYIDESEKQSYIQGATEQKTIDIEKACEIVRNIANEYFGDWEQSCKVEDTFRKAIEE